MNKHEATELGIKLLAILNLINLLSTLPYLLSLHDVVLNSDAVGVRSPWIAPLVILDLLISIFLWFKANEIAQWMWRNSRENEQGASLTAIQLKTILFSAIGLYLLVSVIPDALEFFVYFCQKIAARSNFISFSDYGSAIGFLVRVLISAWLLFNSDGVVNTLQRVKSNLSKRKTT